MSGVHGVLGSGGGAGGAVVRGLADRGRGARVATRSGTELPAGVEDARADAPAADPVRRACAGPSVVHDVIERTLAWPGSRK